MKMFNEYTSPILEILFLGEDIVRTSNPEEGGGNAGGNPGETPIDPNPFGNIF